MCEFPAIKWDESRVQCGDLIQWEVSCSNCSNLLSNGGMFVVLSPTYGARYQNLESVTTTPLIL